MVRISTVAMLLVGAAQGLELRGKPTDYSAAAADIMKMMEGVRQKTEGASYVKPKAPVVKKAVSSNSEEMFPGLDDDLMKKADSISNELHEAQVAKEAPKKKMSAMADKQDSRHDRAARFFATHGMKDMGSMLGDVLSPAEEQKAVQEANTERQKLAASVGRTFTVPKETSSASAAMPMSSSTLDDIPLDDEDDMQKRWKAVDALRKHHH